jgi:hypothetical protein
MKRLKFLTSIVFILFAIGCVLIVVGQTEILYFLMPNLTPKNSPVHSIIRSIGGAFVGSGVFTAIIKSSEYTDVFSNVIGEIIWSKKYIAKRGDKKEIWRMVSRLMYNEKFPAISNEIEDIITNHYFPTSHNFYMENFEMVMNIENIPDNEHFWKHDETISFTLKPTNSNESIVYKFGGGIDLPNDNSYPDVTEYKLNKVLVNGIEPQLIPSPPVVENNILKNFIEIPLKNEDQYHIVLKRSKVICKKTNPDKRFFALYLIKGFKVTVIMDNSMNIDFHKMGTINEYQKSDEHINNDVKVMSWSYEGVILPQQGFIIISK